MKKILCFGSLNIDFVYDVDHIVRPGETLASRNFKTFSGGKGLNQSIALAKAGGNVFIAGNVGSDGIFLLDELNSNNVNIEYVRIHENANSGHGIVQVDNFGENSIIIYGGTNLMNDKEYIINVLESFSSSDILLLQNEINELDFIIKEAKKMNMTIVLNPSPIDKNLLENISLDLIDIFVLNSIEGFELTEEENEENIVLKMHNLFPKSLCILTLGKNGSIFFDGKNHFKQAAFPAKSIDTTGAGDTFCGYFLSSFSQNLPIEECLKRASLAASISVSKKGAAVSIPSIEEVVQKINSNEV